jgi:hypothetical protein
LRAGEKVARFQTRRSSFKLNVKATLLLVLVLLVVLRVIGSDSVFERRQPGVLDIDDCGVLDLACSTTRNKGHNG